MRRGTLTQTLLVALLTLATAIALFPIAWTVITSIKYPADAFTIPPTLIFEPTLTYHATVWTERGFAGYLRNSVIVSIATVLISVPIGTMAAYSLSRMNKAKASPILLAIFSLRMLPHLLLAIPFFVMAQWLGLVDTFWALILAFVAINQPFTIWLMYGFFDEVPRELDEAAYIDGCNSWQVFFNVILPLVRPGMAVTAIFSLLLAYNEFLFSLVLTANRTRTLPVAIASFGGEDVSEWSMAAAGAVGIMLPIIVIMIFMQRNLLRGMTMGAVK